MEEKKKSTYNAEYQKKHKVYSPDEQAKITVAKMNAFDEALGNMEVQIQANQAKLDSLSSKLGEMRESSLDFNINDNGTVQSLRNKIISKNLDIVSLSQKYTDDHPSLIAARKELLELEKSLRSELIAVIALCFIASFVLFF